MIFMMTMIKERKDIRPLLVKFGVALALSFTGFLYSRIRIKRINPSPPPSSDSEREIEYGGRFRIKEDPHAEMDSETSDDTHDKPCIQVRVESSSKNASPSLRCSGDKDMLLLPEFDQIVREFNDDPTTRVPKSPKSDRKAFKIAKEPPMSISSSIERNEYEQEIESLRKKVKFLQEREKDLEIQLLEYYGLTEQEKSMRELQNRLKLSNLEAKLLSKKIEHLQADNTKLEAQVADYSRVVSELEAAKAKIRLMKRKVRLEAQQSKEQILDLTRRVARLRDLDHGPSTSGSDVFQSENESIDNLESEAEELRKANEKLLKENADLARKLDFTQILANSVLEDPEKEELSKAMVHLREENDHLTQKVERLQADRCADAEELVYLRWVNACLRYELRNYRPPPGKTAARDLSKTLSPRSEAKAKQLILEYANTEDGERPPDIIDLDFDYWQSSQHSYLTDTSIDSPTNKPNSKKMKFFAKLIKVITGKSGHHRHSLESPNSEEAADDHHYQRSGSRSPMLASSSQNSNNSSSMDQNRLSSLAEEDPKEGESTSRMSDRGSPQGSGVRFVLQRRNSSALDYYRPGEGKLDEEGQKSELAKYAQVLRGSRRAHKKYASAYI